MAVIFKKSPVKKAPTDNEGVFHIAAPNWLKREVAVPVSYGIGRDGITLKIDWQSNGRDLFPGNHHITTKEFDEAREATVQGVQYKMISCKDWIRDKEPV